MKPLIPLFTALCLCLSPAFAQSDPGDGEQSGLDVFYVSMTKADANNTRPRGADPAIINDLERSAGRSSRSRRWLSSASGPRTSRGDAT